MKQFRQLFQKLSEAHLILNLVKSEFDHTHSHILGICQWRIQTYFRGHAPRVFMPMRSDCNMFVGQG